MRPIGFDYRSKLPNKTWRTAWDWALFCGGLVPALIFGVAFGNLLLGVPFEFDNTLRPTYTGSFFGLLNPFAILAGVVSVAMLLTHGANWLQLKTEGNLLARARIVSFYLSLVTVLLFMLAGVVVANIDGYVITSSVDPLATSNPLTKTVEAVSGAWLNNYSTYSWMLIAPVLGIFAGLGSAWFSKQQRGGWAFLMSSLMMAGIILTAALPCSRSLCQVAACQTRV